MLHKLINPSEGVSVHLKPILCLFGLLLLTSACKRNEAPASMPSVLITSKAEEVYRQNFGQNTNLYIHSVEYRELENETRKYGAVVLTYRSHPSLEYNLGPSLESFVHLNEAQVKQIISGLDGLAKVYERWSHDKKQMSIASFSVRHLDFALSYAPHPVKDDFIALLVLNINGTRLNLFPSQILELKTVFEKAGKKIEGLPPLPRT